MRYSFLPYSLIFRVDDLESRHRGVARKLNSLVALAPDPPKMPFETWLMPRDCRSDFLTTDPANIAAAMQQWFEALAGALDRPACNLWLHRIPADELTPGEHFHWHFELQPRTGQLAGLELGGDMYINSVPAEVAAMRLRAGRNTASS